MPFSIFRHIRSLHQKLAHLDTALKTAFSKIKQDMTELQRRQAELEQRLDMASIKEVLSEEIRREILGMQRRQNRVEPKQEQEVSSEPSVKVTDRSVTSQGTPNTTGFTSLHLELLKRLMVLQMESGKRYLSMRDLASELYPHKTYAIIKATLSEYLKRLHQEGFVEKMHMDRLYISYTEKALQFADNERLNRMKELISKPLQKR
jgi:DNA-binding transcriptional regulator YhcF (GntR family)